MSKSENAMENKNAGTGTLQGAWSQYIPCLLMHLMMPLLPLGLERFLEGHLSEKSLAITAAMYAIALAISSRWTWFAFLGFFASVIYCTMFGAISYAAKLKQASDITTYAEVAIVFLFVAHAIERFSRHIMLREPFFEFNTR
jgi:hypothetical protein